MFTLATAYPAFPQSSGTAMPSLGRDRTGFPRVLTTGVCTAPAPVQALLDGTAVRPDVHIVDGVVTGVFRGTPAWSPPI